MINSLFMLGSSYNKNKIMSVAFMLGWILYMFIGNINYSLGIFPIVNAIIFLVISIIINLIKNKKANTILSIFSILIWSIAIDVFCYFFYPIMNGTNNIFGYVFQGIVYNYKYVLLNVFTISIINVLEHGIHHIKFNSKKETKEYVICE